MFELFACVLHEGTILEIIVEDNDLWSDFLADYARDDRVVRLTALHAEGPAPNAIGIPGLRLIAQRVLEFLNAEALEIQGGVRTTGSTPGRIPAPLRIKRR